MGTSVRSVLTLGAASLLGVAVGVLVNSSGLDRDAVEQPPTSVVEPSPSPSSLAPTVSSELVKAVEDPQPTRDQADGDNSGKGSDNSGKGSGNSGKGSSGDNDENSGGDD